MQPIDLVPSNLSVVSSLVASEQHKLERAEKMLPSLARSKALESVATLVRPATSPSDLLRWMGAQAQIVGRAQKSVVPAPANVGVGEFFDDVPEESRMIDDGAGRTHRIMEVMASLPSGQARSILCESIGEARRWQTAASEASKRLGWRKNGIRGYRTTVRALSDGKFKFQVVRL